MILLQAIIEVFTRSMVHMVAQGFTHRSWVGDMAIGRHAFWGMANNPKCLFKKLLGCLHIPSLAQA
jgi:hypothetical protein